jgi:hypothetical protein
LRRRRQVFVRQFQALETHAGGELLPLRGQEASGDDLAAAFQGFDLGGDQAEVIGEVELVDVFVEELQVGGELGVSFPEVLGLLAQLLVEVEDQVAEATPGGEAPTPAALQSSGRAFRQGAKLLVERPIFNPSVSSRGRAASEPNACTGPGSGGPAVVLAVGLGLLVQDLRIFFQIDPVGKIVVDNFLFDMDF